MMGSTQHKNSRLAGIGRLGLSIALGFLAMMFASASNAAAECNRTLTANVVAIDMPLMWNRLGAQNINGMMYALKRDVVSLKKDASGNPEYKPLTEIEAGGVAIDKTYSGNVALRPDKRPRPLVLRMGAGDCMKINLTNLLRGTANPFKLTGVERSGIPFDIHNDDQVADRMISLRFQGTELVDDISDDGSHVGENASSLIGPGGYAEYTIYAPFDGAFLGVSYGGTVGGEGLGGQTASGLWAVLNVNPKDAAFYRSSVTQEEMDLATTGWQKTTGHPIINYEATYPDDCATGGTWCLEGKAGLPVLNMVRTTDDGTNEMVHTAIDAIVAYGGEGGFMLSTPNTGPHALPDPKDPDDSRNGDLGHFPPSIYPLESVGKRNPTVPNRLEPFRELTVAFHDEVQTTQAFPKWFGDPVLQHTLHGVRDSFMINYGSGGIGSEIIANRLGVGPMHDCVNCAYEEFFLTFSAIGEVGQLTDIPANFGLENCGPSLSLENCRAVGPKANYILYPEDPSNVHHGYTGDATAFRNLHAGPGEQHVFHLHNNQWLFNADDDNSNYIDAQGLGPGSGYAYWINFGGAGNRNKTSGDAIFHCHFYPHFAQGMWEMWRLHDTFEPGTALEVTTAGGRVVHTSFTVDGLGIGNGTPAAGARALPDGEVVAGAPTPAVVPLPGRPMPPMPAMGVSVVENDNFVCLAGGVTDGLVAKNVDGSCPVGSDERRVGSLVDVKRTGAGFALGADGALGGVDANKDTNPGYPFWIAGMEDTIGSRPPTPPLDMITSAQAKDLVATKDPLWAHPGLNDTNAINAIDGWDGGLPRFALEGYSAGGEAVVAITRLDMSKEVIKAKPVFFPEEGTDLEKVAMGYHAQRCHNTFKPDGTEANCPDNTDTNTKGYTGYLTNGALPVPGAPFQEPCIDDRGDLMDGQYGDFFGGGKLWAMQDQSGLTTRGKSPFTSTKPRVYKAANVQFDAVFNKLGYHFPQQRIITLWQDVVPTIKKERPPEPFVLRMNTFDCTQYVHSNVVPNAYELDDYQVRTPTDIIGQHIHLPKWDLTSADGSANGWNYEDGTLSPGAVIEMIHAINKFNTDNPNDAVTKDFQDKRVITSNGHNLTKSGVLQDNTPHPFFSGVDYTGKSEWLGARSTMQRWFADPVVNVQGVDRGLGIIFTHDHYGPSTHQQVGLYATVLIEPAGSEWVHNETGEPLYNVEDRIDGGPTSWQAAILTGDDSGAIGYLETVKAKSIESYREFYVEYTDFQHAYQPGVYVGAGPDGVALDDYDIHTPWDDSNADSITVLGRPTIRDTFRDATQPPVRKQASVTNTDAFPVDIWEFPTECPNIINGVQTSGILRPCPEAITANDPGMYVVNYRNESLAARVFDPDKPGPDAAPTQKCSSSTKNRTGCGAQADGKQGDLAFAMASNVHRAIPELNTKMGLAPPGYSDGVCSGGIFCPPITNQGARKKGDPFTPIMRVNDGDNVKVKMQAGGQEEEHAAIIHGLKWLQGGSGFGEAKNSGWRNAQSGGISEQFTLQTPVYADYGQRGTEVDYAYSMNSSIDGWVNGTWGVLRSSKKSSNLFTLPLNNADEPFDITNKKDYSGVCPKSAYSREYDITAVAANDVLPAPTVPVYDWHSSSHVGGSPTGGGTLVYNSRAQVVDATELGTGGGKGLLHDPTALMYVMTDDLVALDGHGHEVHKRKIEGKRGKGGFVFEAWAGDVASGSYAMDHELKSSDWNKVDDRCFYPSGGSVSYEPFRSDCPVRLRADAPIEPLVIRANAGECIDVKLRNKVLEPATYTVNGQDLRVYKGTNVQKPAFFAVSGDTYIADLNGDGTLSADEEVPAASINWDETLDLATGNAIAATVRRNPGTGAEGMTSFNNNLMQPSAHVGLLPQLVEYDVSRSDGTNVGGNPAQQSVVPGGQGNYKWYAGKLDVRTVAGRGGKRSVEVAHTPIEFGGFNLMPTDKIKQGQKGLVGAGVIYPAGSDWVVDSGTNTAASVCAGPCVFDENGAVTNIAFRDFTTIASKGVSMFYEDSYPVENLLGEGSFGVAEDSQDMGHMNINYGNEAMWFRFGKNPTQVGGNAKCNGDMGEPCLGGMNNAHLAFSNDLIGGADPETPVFTVDAGDQFRMHVLMPFSPGRGSTYDLHGHVWQRDPYVCEDESDHGLAGKCDTDDGLPASGSVGSQSLGDNPVGFHLGAIESWFSGQHYEIVIPSAGGSNSVVGDYLFRDHMGLGSAGGLWGIVRVNKKPPPPPPTKKKK